MDYRLTGGFGDGLWFGVRNFFGAALLALAFGAAIAAICLAAGLILRAALEGVHWLVRLVA